MQELAELLEKVIKGHSENILPKTNIIGKAVNVQDKTCDVEVDGEATLLDVRFQSVVDDLKSYCLIKPKENSSVLVGKIDGGNDEYVVLRYSEIESVTTLIDTVKMQVTKAGVSIKKGNDSLKDVMKLTIEACQDIMVLQGNNPDFKKLATALNKLNNLMQ